MNHQDAVRDLSVEKYLMGELAGARRQAFEEHLFGCELCAADLKLGLTFLTAAREEMAQAPAAAAARPQPRTGKRPQEWIGRINQVFRPTWLVPALAACLLAVGYESVVVVPALRQQIASADRPAIVQRLVLTGGASRGATLPEVTAPEGGSFLLAVDIPAAPVYASYVCSLYSPAGALVWRADVSPLQAANAVEVRVPSAATRAGVQTMVLEGVRQGAGTSAKLDALSRRTFVLKLDK